MTTLASGHDYPVTEIHATATGWIHAAHVAQDLGVVEKTLRSTGAGWFGYTSAGARVVISIERTPA